MHTAYALAKGTQRVGQIARLSGITKGLWACQLRTLYYSTVVPSMLYAAEVFIKPAADSSIGRGSIGIVNTLQRVQCQMALRITGAMRSTPTDVLFTHAGMWSMKHLVNKICARAATHLATCPDLHPIAPLVKQAAHRIARHRSPLHKLLEAYHINPTEYEKIEPFPWNPKTRHQMNTSIAATAEEAILFDRLLGSKSRCTQTVQASKAG